MFPMDDHLQLWPAFTAGAGLCVVVAKKSKKQSLI